MRIFDLISPPLNTTFSRPLFINMDPGKRQAMEAIDALDAEGSSPRGLKQRAAI